MQCPWCGPRDEVEFRWGGESHVARPPESASDAEWTNYLFFRDNPKGRNFERWLHQYGCRRWFNVVRDTVSHKIVTVYPMGDAKPDPSP
jgi:heterotetrameric sarcosine oxidase delta subunit